MLYKNSLKFSVVGNPAHLGLTSFGAPVDGLCRGMLLVSIRAGGPFRRTVLYVLEHSDSGTLALILNSPLGVPQTEYGALVARLVQDPMCCVRVLSIARPSP